VTSTTFGGRGRIYVRESTVSETVFVITSAQFAVDSGHLFEVTSTTFQGRQT